MTFRNNLSVPYSRVKHLDMSYIYLDALFFGMICNNFSTGTKEEYGKRQMVFVNSGKKFTPEFKQSVHRL
jgi:hypothetical protein